MSITGKRRDTRRTDPKDLVEDDDEMIYWRRGKTR